MTKKINSNVDLRSKNSKIDLQSTNSKIDLMANPPKTLEEICDDPREFLFEKIDDFKFAYESYCSDGSSHNKEKYKLLMNELLLCSENMAFLLPSQKTDLDYVEKMILAKNYANGILGRFKTMFYDKKTHTKESIANMRKELSEYICSLDTSIVKLPSDEEVNSNYKDLSEGC